VEQTGDSLRALGIGRSDVVAMVLPNGSQMATCWLSVAAAAVSAPLNPAYSTAEFEFYLADLKAKALVVESGSGSPSIAVAKSMGIPVIHHEAGRFSPEGASTERSVEHPSSPEPNDVALILHTSGSTSRPKMVPLTHANLCNSAREIAASLHLSAADRCLNIMPLFHIHGLVGAVLSSLAAGASVVCTPGFHALNFFDWCEEFQPTWYTAVPTMHQSILAQVVQKRDQVRRSGLRFIRSCSSALSPKLMDELERVFEVPVVEAYGMTEASHQMAINPLPPGVRKPGSVGVATGCEIAILDESGDPLPPETCGDIAVRGPSITSGYQNNPEANAGSFTKSGWFRTGDLGRLDADGYLFLTGRSKEIINRGGEKIAPREIDDVLMDHPAVAQAMAFAIPDERLNEDVAVAIVLKDGASQPTEIELMEFAAARLADFKIPRRFVFLAEIPKGPTGKPQRIGLAQRLESVMLDAPEPKPQFVAPRSAVEKRLAAIWSEFLGVARIGIEDNFLDLGGDSILAGQLVVRIREEFGVQLPLYRLFAAPCIARMAEWIDSVPRLDAEALEPIPAAGRNAPIPLSFTQQRMWFVGQLEGSAGYALPVALRIQGALRKDALQWSLDRIVERHEVLRTTLPDEDGVPVQVIAPPYSVSVPQINLESLPAGEREAKVHSFAREEAVRPFDLSRDFPLRVSLMRLREDEHVLLLTIHHVASDGWSKSVLFRELEALYESAVKGSDPGIPALPIQYADYAVWRRRQLSGPAGERLISYWKERLAGAPALLSLPLDHPRPARQTPRGGVVSRLLPKQVAEGLRALSRHESVTLFMTLLAGFQALLARYSGQTDICVGTPTAHRDRKETEHLIGAFLNTLVMRTDLSGDPSFRDLLARVRETAVGAQDHQDLPLERLIEVLQPERGMNYSPLFQVMFQLRNHPEIVTRLDGLTVSPLEFDPGTALLDLTLDVTENVHGLACVLNYNSTLFEAATAARMLGHYQTLFEAAVADPDQTLSRLPLLTEAERRQILVDWNPAPTDYPAICVHQCFEAQAAKTPEAVAAVYDNLRWTYSELNQNADRIARRLRSLGVNRGMLVALCLDRSLEMLAGLLAIWKAGAAYVPLDPSYPKERLSFILRDAGASVSLTERRLRSVFSDVNVPTVLVDERQDDPGDLPLAKCCPEDLAYVLYTSGSTGEPKGVAIRHRSLANLLHSMASHLEAGPDDTFLAATTISFDIAALELFLPLVTGGRMVMVSRDVAMDGRRFAEVIATSRATIVQATPAAWQLLLDAGWRAAKPLKIVSGGEALSRSLANWLLQQGHVWNGYGPTETTVYSTFAKLAPASDAPPIGRPLANTRVYVLDGERNPAPMGVPGELYIGGDGVAQGYWNRPTLTEAKFVPDPFTNDQKSRLYRTGDMVRYWPDGNLEFLGRIDNQVKIRGFRIELGEIEAALCEHRGVRVAAVKLVESSGDKRLVAFVVPAGKRLEEGDLREHLARKLPAYMLPSAFVSLADLPLTPNGKVDRKGLVLPALRETPRRSRRSNSRRADPRGVVETLLTQIWEDVLDRRPIGIDEDFFALGGHSLLGMRVAARIQKTFGKTLTLASFFEAPTVARMAALLRSDANPLVASQVIGIRSSGGGTPVFIVSPQPLIRALTLRLPGDQPLFGISDVDPSTLPLPVRLEDIAARQIQAMREFQSEGPYILAGWCADGVIAYEMAQQLRSQGEEVPLLVLFDSFNPARRQGESRWASWSDRLGFHLANLAELEPKEAVTYGLTRFATIRHKLELRAARTLYRLQLRPNRRMDAGVRAAEIINRGAVSRYVPEPYEGAALLFRARKRPPGNYFDAAFGWTKLVTNLNVVDVPGNHRDMFVEPNVEVMAQALKSTLLDTGRTSESPVRSGRRTDRVRSVPQMPVAITDPAD
jgi:amino acid adenylation domain-containing protein